MKILICTDGSPESIQTADLVTMMGFPKDTNITILGVSESIDPPENLTEAMENIKNSLSSASLIDRKIRNGNPIEEIMSEAIQASYDLVAVGGGRGQLGFLRPNLGSTTGNLARKLHSHFLVARNIPQKMSKVLFCIGAGEQSDRTIKLGGGWVANTSADVKLLHVVPKEKPGNSSSDSTLQRASQYLLQAGVTGEVDLRIRRGMVVEEVLNELTEGTYDLLVIGAHFQPGQDRWQGILLDDVTDQLLNQSSCSVLII